MSKSISAKNVLDMPASTSREPGSLEKVQLQMEHVVYPIAAKFQKNPFRMNLPAGATPESPYAIEQ